MHNAHTSLEKRAVCKAIVMVKWNCSENQWGACTDFFLPPDLKDEPDLKIREGNRVWFTNAITCKEDQKRVTCGAKGGMPESEQRSALLVQYWTDRSVLPPEYNQAAVNIYERLQNKGTYAIECSNSDGGKLPKEDCWKRRSCAAREAWDVAKSCGSKAAKPEAGV